jgi:hypothetical protein
MNHINNGLLIFRWTLVGHFPGADGRQLDEITASFNPGVRHQLTVVVTIVNDDLVMNNVIIELCQSPRDDNIV